MPNSGYFSVERDIAIEKDGGFFCQGCLIGKPLDDQSPDSRYCLGCYEVLSPEADLLRDKGFTKKPDWWPLQPRKPAKKEKIVPQDMSINMATVKDQKSEVAIIQPPVSKVTRGRRGPKQKDLPVELIEQWRREGLGSKAIAARLSSQGIEVGFRTIARILSGQRVLQIGVTDKAVIV